MSVCIWCNDRIENVGWIAFFNRRSICEKCESSLVVVSESSCTICHKKLQNKEEICRDCQMWENTKDWQGILIKNRSLFYYNAFLKELIAKYKYRGDYEIVYGFRKKFRRAYTNHFNHIPVVPIPLSESRCYARGFNQAEALANQLGIHAFNVLTRHASDKKQSKKTKNARFFTREPMFKASNLPSELIGRDIVIVDDIYTTGATIRHAAKALKEKGVRNVFSLTIARS